MGRLFWKFFFAFFAALSIAGVGVGYAVSLFHESRFGPRDEFRDDRPPPPPRWDEAHPLPPDFAGPLPPPRRGLPPPILAALVGLLASLAASALLAWYFSRPIRHLRGALGQIAEGRFDTRVQQLMAGRRDELADLGRDVDSAARKLDQLVTSQRRLLHDVSHELRSPLARLQAAVGLARQDPAKLAATFDRIELETARLDGLVGELLTLSRLEAGVEGEPKRLLDVMELAAGIAEDAAFEAAAAGRDLVFVGSGEFFIAGRPELLQRAIENVLRNAVKFTRPGTAVEVSAGLSAPGRLRIAVCDRGPGVPEVELESIFLPFRRAAGNTGAEGVGLGLAIARRAVEVHGGSIRATNRSEGGLCVEIVLPAT